MSVLNAQSVGEKIISQGIFGSNILATRDHLGQGDTFDDVANTLGLQSLRYPGGSLTEHYFDLADPDRKTVTDINSNDQFDFALFLVYVVCKNNGKNVTIVLLAQKYLSQNTVKNGDCCAENDKNTLRPFIKATLDGTMAAPQYKPLKLKIVLGKWLNVFDRIQSRL